jgi:LacI family transcriptional regulator
VAARGQCADGGGHADGAGAEVRAGSVGVQQAITELGYRPSAAARGMRGQTYTIGVMLPDLRNPFFPEILDGVTDRLHGTGYHVLLGPGSCADEKAEAEATDALIDRGMDGLILVAPTAPRSRLDEIARTVPTVVIGRHVHSARFDVVVDDDTAGAALVVGHLTELGHRRIAHIEHLETDPARLAQMPNAVRAEGYRQAMRAHGLADEIDVVSTSYTEEGGYVGAQKLLARSVRPTAIFAGADIVAMGVLQAISEAGLSPCRATSRSRATTTPRSPRSARSRSPASTRPGARSAPTPHGCCWNGWPTRAPRRHRSSSRRR